MDGALAVDFVGMFCGPGFYKVDKFFVIIFWQNDLKGDVLIAEGFRFSGLFG